MLNYIKSEFYRMFHSPSFYVNTFVFAGISILLNVVLYLFGRFTPNFPYATTSFSFSNIVAYPMIFCFVALYEALMIYDQSKKNGSLKNAVAFGISRTKILMGQIIVGLALSLITLLVTEAVYISCALLLLPEKGPVTIYDMLFEIAAVFPIAVSALVLGIVLIQLFDRSFIGILVWLCVFCFIPRTLFLIGMAYEPVREIAMWLPQNLFNLMAVNMTRCTTVWDTPQGLLRCLVSGFAGIMVFGAWGILVLRKKEI